MYRSFDHFWNAAWSFGINHLWQSTVFAVFAFAAVSLLRHAPARLRYLIWIVASWKFLLPADLLSMVAGWMGVNLSSIFLSVAWATSNPVALVGRQHEIFQIAGSSNPAFLDLGPLFIVLAVIWFCGSAVYLGSWLKRQIRFSRDLKEGSELTQGREMEILNALQRRLGISREIRMVVSGRILEPGVWGIWSPVLVFPENMTQHLADSELEVILLHELAHVARWDNLISSVHKMVCSLFWFHPMVWWIERRLVAEREHACDDRVLESGGVSRVYASGLMKVLRFGLGFRMAGVSCAGGSNLKERMEHIVSGNRNGRLSAGHKIVLACILSVFAILSVAAIDIGECERYLLQKEWTALQHTSADSCPGEKS